MIDSARVHAIGPVTKVEQELLQLELGLKSALKVEHAGPELEAWLRAEAARRGLSVLPDREPTPSYAGVEAELATSLFVGPNEALLAELREWSHRQRDPHAQSSDKAAAIRSIGAALGYPSCCVEAYIAGREFPDQSLVFLRPLFATKGTLEPLLNLAGNDELISHVPCSYGCGASLELARRTAHELERREPSVWHARWARMCAPVLVLGPRGLVRLEPRPDDAATWGGVRYARADSSMLSDDALRAALESGDELVLRPSSVEIRRGGQATYRERRAGPLDLPVLLRFGGAARRPARVALVDLHRSLIDYMDTMTLAMASGDLTRLGVSNELVRLYVDRERPETWERSYLRLERYLLDHQFTAAVWNMAFDDGVVSRLGRAGMLQVLIDSRFSGAAVPFDFVLTSASRQAFCRFFRLWCEGEEDPEVRELLSHKSDGGWSSHALAEPLAQRARIDEDSFWPTTQYVVPDGEHRPASDVWHLCVNPGCPYGKRLDDNPHFEGLELPDSASARGCSFCEEGGDYEGAPAEPTMRGLLHQFEYIARRAPHSRFILLERAVFRFLERFLVRADQISRGSARRGQRLEFFVTARTDEIVREQAHLREALVVAAERGLLVNLYLVGIESFSQTALDLFNKGTRVEVQVEAIEIMRELEAAFPGTFTASRSSAHGFMLFTPWTTMAELVENCEWMERTRFWEFRSEATLSKLRLYPTVPLFYKARAEGLLAPGYDDEEFDMSIRLGYSKEVPWRFIDAKVEAVYRLLAAAADHYPRGSRELTLLRDAIAEVETHGTEVDAETFHAPRRARRAVRPGLGRPRRRRFTLALGSRSNLGCTYYDHGDEAPPPPREELAQRLLDGRKTGESAVTLGGAEPLLSPSLMFAVRAARRCGYSSIALETNALGLDTARMTALREAGLTRVLPFLPAWDREPIDRIARVAGAAALLFRAAPAIEGSGLEVQPVIPVARETLAELPRFVELAELLFPSARGLALRFFPSEGTLPHARTDGPGERPLVRFVEAADSAGLGVTQVADVIVPPCAFSDTRALEGLMVLDTPPSADFRRIPECSGCALVERCRGVSEGFARAFPHAPLTSVRSKLPAQ